MSTDSPNPVPSAAPHRPFKRAVLRGLAVMLPPVLTVVIFLWIFGTVQAYLLGPVRNITVAVVTWSVQDIHYGLQLSDAEAKTAKLGDKVYQQLDNRQFVPIDVYNRVLADPGEGPMPNTASEVYRRYVELEFVQDRVMIPVFLCCFVLVLYLLGKTLTAEVGRALQWVVQRLPLVRNVYASVKQVTDFMFRQAELHYARVVAVEYPRPGVWGIGFVTGEGMREVNQLIHEPCWTVVLPGSPGPITGYAITVPKSKAIELDITIDQALQYLISCGVVIPRQQRVGEAAKLLANGAAPAPSAKHAH